MRPVFRLCLIGLAALWLASCQTAKVRPQTADPRQLNYFPKEFVDLWIGMPFADFAQVRPVAAMDSLPGSHVSYYHQNRLKHKHIQQATYQFDQQRKLYEVIIQYDKSFDIQHYLTSRYGRPNKGPEWEFVMGKDKLLMWIFDGKLCIADAKYF